MRAFQLPAISLILHTLDFNVYAVADLAPVTVTCSQQLARLFGSLGLDAPFFHTRDMHGRVEGLGFSFSAATAMGCSQTNHVWAGF